MTAVELRTSINEDLDTLGIETLEYVSKYVRRLALRARNRKKLLSAKPRKVQISSRIRSMSGRFSVPSDIDYNSLKTDVLEEKYDK
jgi:hypothetical protein